MDSDGIFKAKKLRQDWAYFSQPFIALSTAPHAPLELELKMKMQQRNEAARNAGRGAGGK